MADHYLHFIFIKVITKNVFNNTAFTDGAISVLIPQSQNMVTTIKITCDGVFIQSNSYLNTPAAATTTSTVGGETSNVTSTTTITETATKNVSGRRKALAKHTDNCKEEEETDNGDDDDDDDDDDKKLKHSYESAINSSSKKFVNTNRVVNRVPASNKTDTRRRYYFGSNNIYWCKQSCTGLNAYKSDVPSKRNHQTNLMRSASSVTHKELQNTNYKSAASRRRYNKLTNYNSFMPISQKKSNPLKEFYLIDRYTSVPPNTNLKLGTNTLPDNSKSVPSSSTLFFDSGIYVNTSYKSNLKSTTSDKKFLSFLRSARKLYRNSSHEIKLTDKVVEDTTDSVLNNNNSNNKSLPNKISQQSDIKKDDVKTKVILTQPHTFAFSDDDDDDDDAESFIDFALSFACGG
uniref:Uncharacterized protein n=1 Tax=Glossina pallidipes TaxID=7398 RepID=A0A1A9ZJN6_GLOPL